MSTTEFPQATAAARLPELTRYIYGTTRLADIHTEIEQLQRGWYEQHDQFAEPWSI